MKVSLGDYVRDTVSCFEGTIISEHRYVNGCTRFTVQPKIDKDGKLPTCETFDKPDLDLLFEAPTGTAEKIANPNGGPEKYSDIGRR